MLVLTRKCHEELILTIPASSTESHIVVKILHSQNYGNTLKIGVAAQRKINIVRSELLSEEQYNFIWNEIKEGKNEYNSNR